MLSATVVHYRPLVGSLARIDVAAPGFGIASVFQVRLSGEPPVLCQRSCYTLTMTFTMVCNACDVNLPKRPFLRV